MPRVLILCDLFPPAFGPRMGYLCKYLRDTDWTADVIAEMQPGDGHTFDFLTGYSRVTFINYYAVQGRIARKWQWAGVQILRLLFDYKNRRMIQVAERKISEQHYDLILCSSFRNFPLPAAAALSRRHRIPWIADLRDIVEQYSGNEFLSHPLPHLLGLDRLIASAIRAHLIASRNKAIRTASAVTTVSPWHVDWLKSIVPEVHLICNGYDPELFFPEQIPTDRFVITYTGRLLSTAMRDPHLLLEALAVLFSSGKITPDRCEVDWYVDEPSWQIISAEAARYQVTDFMKYKGQIPAQQIPGILNRSSVILLLTNKASGNGPRGIMTTKFYEAIAVGKPILCVTGDEDCLEAAIDETRAGISGHNTREVCDFLFEQYETWKRKGFTSVEIDPTADRYSRKMQALQFTGLFDEVRRRASDIS